MVISTVQKCWTVECLPNLIIVIFPLCVHIFCYREFSLSANSLQESLQYSIVVLKEYTIEKISEFLKEHHKKFEKAKKEVKKMFE